MITQKQAVLLALMRKPNQKVAMPEIVEFTRNNCRSACYAVHSRVSDLRMINHFNIGNDTENGISNYWLEISADELQQLKKVFSAGQEVPDFNEVKAKTQIRLKPTQASMFSAEPCRV